ncbi:MAG: hypothetical protein KAU49_03120 [Candidatus Krumholzibacteria bacterium]|nr:hypothetical protein [Candidatus Krumholzibacteria bacterium]
MSWTERRNWIYSEIADAFASRTGISSKDFLKVYVEAEKPPPISDFEAQYIPDSETLKNILEALGESAGVGEKTVAHYDRRESFVQFAEHLLRAGAAGKGDES